MTNFIILYNPYGVIYVFCINWIVYTVLFICCYTILCWPLLFLFQVLTGLPGRGKEPAGYYHASTRDYISWYDKIVWIYFNNWDKLSHSVFYEYTWWIYILEQTSNLKNVCVFIYLCIYVHAYMFLLLNITDISFWYLCE